MTNSYQEMKELEYEDLLENGMWKTSDGDRVYITDMSDGHLGNTVNAITDERINLFGYEEEFLGLMNAELERRREEGYEELY